MVAVGGSAAEPEVLRRRRVELCDRGVSGSVQPYHAAADMGLKNGETFLQRCRDTARVMARDAVRDAISELRNDGYNVAGCSILLGSGRLPGELAAVLASHPLIHTAEGEFFRDALKAGCEMCGLPVMGVKERDVAIPKRISELGRSIGPPWRADEKLAAMAAWLVLV